MASSPLGRRLLCAIAGLSVLTLSAQTVNWTGNVSTSWFTSSNWSGSAVPNNVHVAVSTAGTVVTTGATSNVNVAGLDLSSSAAQLLFDFSSSDYGVNLGTGTSAWTAGNVTIGNSYGIYGNGITNTTLSLSSGVELLYNTDNLTRNLYNLTVSNSGSIHDTSGVLSISNASLANQSGGLVHADGAEIDFSNGTSLNNLGTLRATGTGGILRFNGSYTSAGIGTVNLVSGGHAYIAGSIDNTSATLSAPSGGSFELIGGTITGGTIASGAVVFTGSGGYLSGATLNDNLSLPASTYVRFINNAAFSGSTMTLGASAGLYWQQAATLSGKAISLGNGSYIYVAGGNSTLRLSDATTATGDLQIYSDGSAGSAITNQGTLTHTSATSASIYAPTLVNSGSITNSAANTNLFIGSTSTGYNTTNTGSITVNATGANIYLDGNVDSTGGTLNATNGALIFRGNNTAAHITGATTNIAASGHVYLNGTIANAGTFTMPASGIYELYGGTITGGTIAPGALTFTGSGGYLDGTTLNDNFSLPASTYVRFINNAAFSGSTMTLGASAGVYWQQAATLFGKSITFANGSYIDVAGGNSTLTLSNTTTATGDLQIYSDGSAGTGITNQGTLTHTSASTGYLYALALANSGSITNSAANTSLFIGSTSTGYNTTNTGSITVDATGANIYLDGNVDSTGGTLNATNGALIFRGNNTAAHINGATTNIAASGHVYLDGTIANAGTFTTPASGIYELYGGTITGGTIAPNALTFTSSGGYLDGTTLNDNLSLPASTYVRFINNAAFSGSTMTLGASAGLYWQQAATLSGKAIILGNGGYIYVAGGNSTLTLSNTTTATGDLQIYSDGSAGSTITNQGTLTHTSTTSASVYAPTLVNSGSVTNSTANTNLFIGSTSTGYNTTNTGSITVNATGANIYLDGNVDSTGGTLNATNGALIFRGNNTAAHINGATTNIAASGHVYLNGTIANPGTFSAPTSGIYELYGGTIAGGAIAPNALTFTSSGGYLDGTTLNDNFSLPASTYVRFINNAAFSGSTMTLGASAGLYWQQAATLSGKAITLGNGSYIYVAGGNSTLALSNTTTATGDLQIYSDGSAGTGITNQGTLTHTSASTGYLYALALANSGSITNSAANTSLFIGSTSNGYNTTNTGNITVNGSGANVYLDGNFDDTGGTLNATNGALVLRGNNVTAHLNGGTTNISAGGHVYLNGTLDNTGATLNAPTGGAYELYGGTIKNGTIAAGALSFTSNFGTLNNVTVLGNVTFPTSSHAYFTGNTTLATPSAALNLGASAGIYWQQAGTLVGNTLTLGSSAYVYVTGGNDTLTLDPSTTATGDVEIYSDGSAGTAITNQGALTHTTGTGYLYAMNFTNAGSITVSGGTMYLGVGWTGSTVANNAGATIRLNGGNLYLQTPAANPLVNNGTIAVQSGTFYTNGGLSNGATGLISGSGVISGNLIVSGGTLSPGNGGIGTLTFNGGTLTVAAPATFLADLGGANSDQMVFSFPSNTVNIGSGLLTLSLNLLSAPTATTYNLITISGGSYGLSGSFAGLPNSGNTISASFDGNPYTFTLNYQPNAISLSFNPVVVPEPSAYALMVAGIAFLFANSRRRKGKCS